MKQITKMIVMVLLFVIVEDVLCQKLNRQEIIWKGNNVQVSSDFINVKLKTKIDKRIFQNFLITKELSLDKDLDILNYVRIKINNKTKPLSELIADFQKSDIFEVVEPDFVMNISVTPSDSYYSNQYALPKVNAPDAWEITKGSNNITIAILDSGIPISNSNLSHEDLLNTNRIIEGVDYVNDGNGVKDENGHGTHVAGITGAETNNNKGISGVNWYSKLKIYQVFNEFGSGYSSYFKDAVIDAVNSGCKIVNYSGGSVSSSQIQEDAVEYAQDHGVLVVAAAGNYHSVNNPNKVVFYPAAFSVDYDNVIAVSATNSNDVLASFSSRGAEVVFSAPGDNIYSTLPDYEVYANTEYGYNQDYDYLGGTSMAAPLVSGFAGLLLSQYSWMNYSDVIEQIKRTAEDLGTTGKDNYYGYGRIDIGRALTNIYVPDMIATISSAISIAEPGQIINVDGSQTLLYDIDIPTGITLKIKTGATINLNGRYIKSTGGSIVQESGSTINGLNAYLKYYSTLKGYFPSVSSAISNASYYQTVELLDKTYNENISIVDKTYRYLQGASSGNTVLNGNITITNSSYASVSNLKMDGYKYITVNGGYRTNVSGIFENNSSSSVTVSVYDGNNTQLRYLDIISGSANFALNLYNTNSYNLSYLTIEGHDCAIYATSNSSIGVSSSSFCNNLLDLYAGSGSSIYGQLITMSYPGAFYGNCSFGTVDYCGSMAKVNSSQLAESGTEISDNLKEANNAFIELLADKNINKSSTLSEESKSKIHSVITAYKNSLSKNLSENEKNEALKKLSSCYAMIEDESSFADYVSELLSGKRISNEMKRFLIPSLINKESCNEALSLIDEILTYNGISQDLEYELLYEKGTILKYYLEENEKAEKVFVDLYKNAGKHALANFAKAQIENQSGIDDGNKEIDEDNSELSKDFEISSYPNPFNPTTTIAYQIPNDGFVNLVVYNTLGQVVSTLVNEHQTSGKYSVQFNASNLPSGVYFYKIESGNFTKVNKILLLR